MISLCLRPQHTARATVIVLKNISCVKKVIVFPNMRNETSHKNRNIFPIYFLLFIFKVDPKQ